MKFRNPKTGEVIVRLHPIVCYCEFKCNTCPLDFNNNEYHVPCSMFILEHQEEAAKLLGYEILDEGDTP